MRYQRLIPFLVPATALGAGMVLIAISLWQRAAPLAPITLLTESTSSGALHIDVAGSVQKPDVYVLAAGSRVADALAAAGGLSADADREWVSKFINRAAPVVDGAKFYIPKRGEAAKPAGEVASASVTVININTATASELDTLPGIGEKTAEKIIAGRPYESVEALLERKIVGPSVFADIKNLIRVY